MRLSQFINPSRRARAVPLGRFAIMLTFITATIFVLYSLGKDRFALPFVSERYTIQAEFTDAAGLDPSNEPPVAVAGTPAGKVVGVEYRDGRALVTMELDTKVEGKVFRDASVRARPLNAANILAVNITPGTPSAGALPEGGVISAQRASIPVASDEVLGMLDADTRAYLHVLVGEASVGLDGRGSDLADMLRQLGPLTDASRPVARLLAERRRLITQLVGETTRIVEVTAQRSDDLARTIDAGTRVLQTTGSQQSALAASVRGLPALLDETRSAFGAVRSSGPVIVDALAQLRPATATFAPALRATRELTGPIDDLVGALGDLGRRGAQPAAELRGFLDRLHTDGTASIDRGLDGLLGLVKGIDERKEGLRLTGEVLSGVTSIQDSSGPVLRINLGGIDTPDPAKFGLPAGSQAQLDGMLAQAFARRCRTGSAAACVLRFLVPGLPGSVAR